MAAPGSIGMVNLCSLETGYTPTLGYYIKGIITFVYNSAYQFRDNESLRLYYPSPQQVEDNVPAAQRPRFNIVPPDSTATGADILKADSWVKPYEKIPINQLLSPTTSEKKTKYITPELYTVTFTLPNLTPNTDYEIRAVLRLFKKPSHTSPKYIYYGPSGKDAHLRMRTWSQDENIIRPMFCVAKYTYVSITGETVGGLDITWEDFTDCIKLPSYNVNSNDVNEDWDDANYTTHRIVARKKIEGKFEMIFPSIERQKYFFYLLDKSRELNGDGIAYVDLKVHVNNMLDYDLSKDYDPRELPCINYIGKFFIKIDNNAWVQPIYGHYDKYSPLSITITET